MKAQLEKTHVAFTPYRLIIDMESGADEVTLLYILKNWRDTAATTTARGAMLSQEIEICNYLIDTINITEKK